VTGFDPGDDDIREPRTAIFPVVDLPAGATDVPGYVLVASGLISIAAGVVRAVSYRFPQTGGSAGFVEVSRRLTVADRIQLLASGAGPLPAVLLLLGAVCLVMGARSHEGGRWRAGLLAAAVGAAIVVLGNAALGIAVLANANGTFIHSAGDRFPTLVQLLAPIALAGGVLFYVYVRLSSEAEEAVGGNW